MPNPKSESIEELMSRVEFELRLLRERRFDELESFLRETHAHDADDLHSKLCEIAWMRGEKKGALERIVGRLKAGNYSIGHVLLGAQYACELSDVTAATYLRNEFVSKFDETSSINLIGYVYKILHELEPSDEEESAAAMLLPEGRSKRSRDGKL